MRRIFLLLLSALMIMVFISACESEAPLNSDRHRVDTLVIIDTIVIYDSTTVFDTVLVIDSAFIFDTTIVYDSSFSYDTLWIVDTIFSYDSTIIIDTIFINDSLFIYDTTVIYDSSFSYDTTVVYDTIFDSIFIFDTTVTYDSIFVFDTLTIIDTVIVPSDSLVYQACAILKCNTKIATLGRPGYFVTVSRSEVNGHPIKFCLYVYLRDGEYFGVLSASHLKAEWPVVTATVEATNNDPILWVLDKKHQTMDINF